jgi:inosine/xanthosine triphosphate pyrophosphatase family protein
MVTKEIILDILNDKDNFVNIVKDFPGLYSACVTIKQNVSNENVNVAMNKILTFIDKNEKFKNLIQSLILKLKEKEIQNNDVSGTVLEINKDDNSYSELIEKSKKEKWHYKGLTIVDGYDKLKVYFY